LRNIVKIPAETRAAETRASIGDREKPCKVTGLAVC